MTGLVILVINSAVWACRPNFSKRAHFVQWLVTNIGLLLMLPYIRTEFAPNVVTFLEHVSVVAQIAVFSAMTALTPFHGVAATFIAISAALTTALVHSS